MGNCKAITKYGTGCLNSSKKSGLCMIHYKKKYGSIKPLVFNKKKYEDMDWKTLSKFVVKTKIMLDRLKEGLQIMNVKHKMMREILDKKIKRGGSIKT